MLRRRNSRIALASSVLAAGVFVACYAPTGIELRLDTDECARAGERFETGIFVGGGRVDDAPRTTTDRCEPAGDPKIGTLVLVPDGDRDAQLRVEVVLAVNATAEECKANGYVLGTPGAQTAGPRRGCVVQKRRLGFRPHKMPRVSIALNQARCFNVACPEGTTCGRDGTCVSDECRDGSCEEALPPAPAGQADGGVTEDARAPDASTVDDVVYAGGAPINGGLHHVSDTVLVFGEGNAATAQMVTYDVVAKAATAKDAVPGLVQVFATPEEPTKRVSLAFTNPDYLVQVFSGAGSPSANAPVIVSGTTPSLARAFGNFGVAFTAAAGGKGVWRTVEGAPQDLSVAGEPIHAAGDASTLAYVGRNLGVGSPNLVYVSRSNGVANTIDMGSGVAPPMTLGAGGVHAADGQTIRSASLDGAVTDMVDVGASVLALEAVGKEVYFVTEKTVGRVTPALLPAVPPMKPPPTILATRPGVVRKTSFITVTSSTVFWTEGNEIHAVAR